MQVSRILPRIKKGDNQMQILTIRYHSKTTLYHILVIKTVLAGIIGRIFMFKFENFKIAGFSALLIALSTNAFADLDVISDEFTIVKDIKDEAQCAVISYLKDDPTCHSCRGNGRSAGVNYLEQVRDNSAQQEYLRGKVWSNSCQNGGNGFFGYGSPDASLRQCGYTEVKFLLPITKNADVWTADFSHIKTDVDDETQVPQVIPATLFSTSIIQAALVDFVKTDSNYPPLQIDIEQIFNLCIPYLD